MKREKTLIYMSVVLFLVTIGHICFMNKPIMNLNKVEEELYYTATSNSAKIEDVQKALTETAYSYYMRGDNIQYNTMKANHSFFAPEEATDQNMNYVVCSALVKNIYYEALGIKTPANTSDLLEYSKNNLSSPEVIAYGKKNANDDLIMKFYDAKASNKYTTVKNPTLEQILPYLQRGDILTYTGHAIFVYDLIYDSYGNIIDAYVIHALGRNNISTKIADSISIGGKIKFGNDNHFLYYYSKKNKLYDEGLVEGAINLTSIKSTTGWKNISKTSKKSEYSILRFVQKDAAGNAVLLYNGTDYDDKKHSNELVELSSETKSRINFNKLYIEKTVSAHADDIVQGGEELTYTIRIKNNSDKNYTQNIIVKEQLNENITYKVYNCNKSGISIKKSSSNLEWDLGKLAKGEEIVINYKVTVKDKKWGKVIESKGTVNNIPTTVVKNTISYNLTEDQQKNVESKYNSLKGKYNGKELINEIYVQALRCRFEF